MADLPRDAHLLKIAIRTEAEDGLVVAALATLDGKMSYPFATISLSVMRLDGDLADAWQALVSLMGMKAIEAGTGATIEGFSIHDPSDLESKPQG